MFGLRDGGWGGWVHGYQGQKKFVYLKRASHSWLFIQNFIFPSRKNFGRVRSLAWKGGGSAR